MESGTGAVVWVILHPYCGLEKYLIKENERKGKKNEKNEKVSEMIR